MTAPSPANVPGSLGAPVFGVVFLLVFGFSYSEEMVTAGLEATGHEGPAWRTVVIVVDVVILVAVGLLKRAIGRIDGGAPGLWAWWWAAAIFILVYDLILDVFDVSPPLWANQILALTLAVAMGLMLTTSLNADPLTLLSARKRAEMPLDWQRVRAVVPLVIGSYAAYAGAALWWDYLTVDVVRDMDAATAAAAEHMALVDRGEFYYYFCAGAVSPRYFEQMTSVIPLLLITLGIEFGFFRRYLRDPVQRITTGVTVMLMCVGLVGTLSTLPWEGFGCGQVVSKWHEYAVFVLTLQGVFTGLATLVWQLLVAVPDVTADRADDGG